jgi:hypothetical protein
MVKPGYRTSEFWFTVVSFVFSGLYLVGLLDDNAQKEDLIQETSRGLEATILIIGQLTVLFKYINGRTKLKQTWWSTATEAERKEANRRNSKSKKKTKPKPKIKAQNNDNNTISK